MPTLLDYKKISIQEELQDLAEELEDAQRNYDEDKFNLDKVTKDIVRSTEQYATAVIRLAEFKNKHNLK